MAHLTDPHLADAIWELLDAGIIDDEYAAGAWQLIATEGISILEPDR